MKPLSRLPVVLAFIITMTMSHAVSAAAPTTDASAGERKAVLGVVQKFFDTMSGNDVDGAKAILLTDGQYYAVRGDPGGLLLRRRTHEEHLARLAAAKDHLLERMWDATVMVHEQVAMVWTPYDFHLNGKFSHSGVDVFTLIKTDGGWKIAGIVFTMEPKIPSQHPAGPPPAAALSSNPRSK